MHTGTDFIKIGSKVKTIKSYYRIIKLLLGLSFITVPAKFCEYDFETVERWIYLFILFKSLFTVGINDSQS